VPNQPCRTVPTDAGQAHFSLQRKGFHAGACRNGPAIHGVFVPALCPPAAVAPLDSTRKRIA